MANRNIEELIYIINNIRAELERFLDKEGRELKSQNIKLLQDFVKSFLFFLNSDLNERKNFLEDKNVFDFVFRNLASIEGEIRKVVHNDRGIDEKIDELLKCTDKIKDIIKDLHLMNAIEFNYRDKVKKLEEKLLKENTNKINGEILVVRNRLKEVIDENKLVNESEINSLRERLKTIVKNNDDSLSRIFREYDEEIHSIKEKQLEENRIKNKAFEEFMNEVVLDRDGMIDRFEKYFSKIQSDWKKIQQIKTENVYLNSYHKNTARSKNSESKFIGVTVFSLILSLITIIAFIFKAIDLSQFISIKIMIVVFFGILIAYYLKISTHYRRLADQAEQTHLELLAFPQYAAELGEEKSKEIKEQLALKYFGKEIDPSGYQKIGEIAQEQLKTSSELVKAAASITQGAAVKKQNTNTNPPAASTGGN